MKEKQEKWIANLVAVTFAGKKKIKEEIIKSNLTKKDLEIIKLFSNY